MMAWARRRVRVEQVVTDGGGWIVKEDRRTRLEKRFVEAKTAMTKTQVE